MSIYPPQTDFLKLKLSDKILLGFICSERPTRSELGSAGSIPTSLRYIFKRYHRSAIIPTLMGDVLVVDKAHLDRHLKPQDVEILSNLFMRHGFELEQFSKEAKAILRISNDFKRANYYAPREELLGIKGEVIDMEQSKPLLRLS